MKRLVSVRPMVEPDCNRLVREFEAQGVAAPERWLGRFIAEGRAGERKTVVAEAQTHVMTLVGLASVRFGGEGWPGRAKAAELTDLIVLPRYRRYGVATRLLEAVEADLVDPGSWLVVRPEAFQERPACRALLAKCGYAPILSNEAAVDPGRLPKTNAFPGSIWGKQKENRPVHPS